MAMKLNILCIVILFNASASANAEYCLRFADQSRVEEVLQSLAPMGTDREDVKIAFSSNCEATELYEHHYLDIPLKSQINNHEVEVWSWIKVQEGPFRFAKRLFLKSYVVGSILFDKKGKVVGYKIEIQTASL
ncbi:hypothetical protein CWE08_12070 [Aliidiomarina iranensis]|uniref:Uncharacterized protein n=1 Tax=Aliidiomarina iranensis TaxID=1434071 RepID=A0A432VPH7_9GAMM|nr:hypothetical protein [Aliidiomarina iranensis]RUO18004.1 hypothetical protein CWE08_12070 [Aliidiomarina iranensis]